MKYELVVYPDADDDVDGHAEYIARDSLETALRFYANVVDTYEEIAFMPLAWPELDLGVPALGGLRKRGVIGFGNHLVIYRVTGNVVEVLCVVHGARDLPAVLSKELL